MFKLGEYLDESVAKDIAKYLQDAGMKVDIKTTTHSQIDTYDYLEGRVSELKDKINETEFQKYERYLNALRAVLANGATSENFREMFQIELNPAVNEKKMQLQEMIEEALSEDDLFEGVLERDTPTFATIMAKLFEISLAESFADSVLLCNEINIGEDVGERLDDPILQVPYDPEDYDDENPSSWARTNTVLTFQPWTEVYIDEFSATLAEELDEVFKEEYDEEFFNIDYLAEVIFNLMESSSGKMDMETFTEKCEIQMEHKGNTLTVTGRNAASNIARSLEKNGVIRVKGNSVKWKR